MNLSLPFGVIGLLAIVSLSVLSGAQDSKNHPTIGRVIRDDPRLDDLIGADAKIEVLGMGFAWSEGPVDGGFSVQS